VGADRDLSTDARQMGEGRQGREAGGAPGGDVEGRAVGGLADPAVGCMAGYQENLAGELQAAR